MTPLEHLDALIKQKSEIRRTRKLLLRARRYPELAHRQLDQAEANLNRALRDWAARNYR